MGVPLMLFKGTPKNFFRPFYQAPLWPVTPLHQAPTWNLRQGSQYRWQGSLRLQLSENLPPRPLSAGLFCLNRLSICARLSVGGGLSARVWFRYWG